ncbi:MAG TPA: alpha/beta fold hydrolase [Candidatus Dormibacteraeota bacterium]
MAERLAEQASEAVLGANPFVGIDARQVAADTVGWAGRMALRPRALAGEAAGIARELGRIAAGRSLVTPAPGDKRFGDPTWQENPAFRRLLQSYLTLTAGAHRLVDQADLEPLGRERAHFAVTLIADALAPTNSPASNPAAVKRAFETAGRSLVRGTRQLSHDLRHNGGMPALVDERPFTVGGNIATSPGAVVYRNEVLELIQYRPSTETVHERPLVVIPPQINKFYVLDLAPGRSFTEYAVSQGIPYFAISWRNPTAEQRSWGLDTYVRACVRAIDAVVAITGSPQVNLMGLCAGGVTLSALLGHLAAKGKLDRVASATLCVAMLDMRSPSMIGLFATDSAIARALRRSRERGILDGGEMARVFAWMRPNDLVWNYWVNNYLLGADPPAFDILFWNADNTRLPARLHADFLDLYLRNPLPRNGAARVLGTPIDLGAVDIPTYVLAGTSDHIVPWQAAYRSTQIFGGRPEFVLSSSGHIQSIVNPPGNPKASYFHGGRTGDDPDAWLAGATHSKGSWWEHWADWLGRHSGERRPAPSRLGGRRHAPGTAAPGRYVLQR